MSAKKRFWTKKRLYLTALIISVCALVGALVYLGVYYRQIYAHKRLESEINQLYESVRQSSLPPSPSPIIQETPGPEITPDESIPAEEEAPVISEWQREFDRRREASVQGREIFADFLKINKDFLAVVSIPGLVNTLPFVQADNNDYYLTRTFDGKSSITGTIFLDARNNSLLMDNNSVLYGHHIQGGAMFAPIMQYKQANTFKKSPVILTDGLIGEITWIVFAAYVTEPDWGYIAPCNDREEFSALLSEIMQRSLFVTDVDVNEDDRILTLSTCDYTGGYEDIRFAVHARQLRPGEEIPQEVIAVENPDQKAFSVPMQQKLSDIAANRAAVMLHPTSNKLHFYQPRGGGIDRYAGNQSTVQGIYNSYSRQVAADSFLAAVYDPEGMLYVAADNFNRQRGITLLTGRYVTSNLIPRGTVTPEGVDAKWPALVYEDGLVWLLYTAARDGGEDIYRLPLQNNAAAGEPELLFTAPEGSGARPLGAYVVDGALLLFWHEAANKLVYASWGGGEAFSVPLTGDADRVTLYGEVTASGTIRAAIEKNGKFSFTTVELGALPRPDGRQEP